MAKVKLPLSELLRPKKLEDLTLPKREIARLKYMIESGDLMSMVFSGPPGLGKTSAARVLIEASGGKANCLETNGSLLEGIEYVRETIEPYIHSTALFAGPKVIFVDEADYMPAKAQASLRHMIEKSYKNVRWLFTANNVSKFDKAIMSRLHHISFEVSHADANEMIEQLTDYYERKLTELGIKFDSRRLFEIVCHCYPDYRVIANRLHFEFCLGDLPEEAVS